MPRQFDIAVAAGYVLAGGIALAAVFWLIARNDETPVPAAPAVTCTDFPEFVSECERVVQLAQADIAAFWSRPGYSTPPYHIQLANWPTTCLGGALPPPCKPIHTGG